MLKELFDSLFELKTKANGPILIDGRNYMLSGFQEVKEPAPSALRVNTLSAVLDYLAENLDGLQRETLTIHVESPTEVKVLSAVFGPFKQRACHMQATALLPDFPFDVWVPAEEFVPALKARFLETEDLEALIRLTGNIKHETEVQTTDDGITQRVEARVGIARHENVSLPPVLLLKPYRTFLEAEQPESSFVYRVKEGPACKLIEADGGAWQLEAMQNVKTFLEDNMPDGVEVAIIV